MNRSYLNAFQEYPEAQENLYPWPHVTGGLITEVKTLTKQGMSDFVKILWKALSIDDQAKYPINRWIPDSVQTDKDKAVIIQKKVPTIIPPSSPATSSTSSEDDQDNLPNCDRDIAIYDIAQKMANDYGSSVRACYSAARHIFDTTNKKIAPASRPKNKRELLSRPVPTPSKKSYSKAVKDNISTGPKTQED